MEYNIRVPKIRPEHLAVAFAEPDCLHDDYRLMLVAFTSVLDVLGFAGIGQYGFTV